MRFFFFYTESLESKSENIFVSVATLPVFLSTLLFDEWLSELDTKCGLDDGCHGSLLEAGLTWEDLVVLFLSGLEIDGEKYECPIPVVALALVQDDKLDIAYDFDEWETWECECECESGSILELLCAGVVKERFFGVDNGAVDGNAFLPDDVLGVGGVVFGAGK